MNDETIEQEIQAKGLTAPTQYLLPEVMQRSTTAP